MSEPPPDKAGDDCSALREGPSTSGVLRAWPACAALADEDVEVLASGSQIRAYARLEHIFWRGGAAESLHVVAAGQVRRHVSTESRGELTVAVMARAGVLRVTRASSESWNRPSSRSAMTRRSAD